MLTIQHRFEEFHQANPHVYDELVRLIRIAKSKGQRCGIRMVWEVVRWNQMMTTDDPNGVGRKMNDHYHSRYVRLIVAQEPDLSDFFELRELKAA